MNCEDFGKYLDNYENLTASEKSQMLDHAAACEKCQAELDFFLSMIATTNSLPKIEPPADFMDSLNARLDAEDKRVVSASRIVYHIRRNWRQYTAAAACLALVTVITANRSMLLDRYVENNDDGIISEETAPTGSTPAPENAAQQASATDAPAVQSADTPQQSNAEPTSQPAPAQPVRRSSTAAATAASSVRRQSSAKSQASSKPASTVIAQAAPITAAEAQEQTAPAAESQAAQQENDTKLAKAAAETGKQASASSPQEDYGIARVIDSTASASYDLRAEDVKASLDASEVKANYSLAEGGEEIAYGRYYTLDRNGNPISSASGIGSIKISSEDAELAMEIIDRYPHDESGNVYTTDSVNLTRILSKLKSEGVSFTDYTLGDTGEVKFKVIFN